MASFCASAPGAFIQQNTVLYSKLICMYHIIWIHVYGLFAHLFGFLLNIGAWSCWFDATWWPPGCDRLRATHLVFLDWLIDCVRLNVYETLERNNLFTNILQCWLPYIMLAVRAPPLQCALPRPVHSKKTSLSTDGERGSLRVNRLHTSPWYKPINTAL